MVVVAGAVATVVVVVVPVMAVVTAVARQPYPMLRIAILKA